MKNELTKVETELAKVIDTSPVSDLLKPLVEEIHLFDTYVAGTSIARQSANLKGIEEGEKLTLKRETNRFDENEILIFRENDRQIGRIPEQDNIIFARLMDAGKKLSARVISIEWAGSFPRIRIGIYLEDF